MPTQAQQERLVAALTAAGYVEGKTLRSLVDPTATIMATRGRSAFRGCCRFCSALAADRQGETAPSGP
jgi:hypothetical protein